MGDQRRNSVAILMAADLTKVATDLSALRSALLGLGGNLLTASSGAQTTFAAAMAGTLIDIATAMALLDAHMASSVSSVGLVAGGVDGRINAAVFLSYLSAAEQAPHLFDMLNFVQRMQDNTAIAMVG